MTSESVVIYWLRNDLRLADNPALTAALATGHAVLPVYIWSPEEEGDWAPGAASRVWLHESLKRLAKAYEALGSRLVLRQGDSAETLHALCDAYGTTTVFTSRRYEPHALHQEARVRDRLKGEDVTLQVFNGSLLNAPDAVATQAGDPYKVFTPYYNACVKKGEPDEPFSAPQKIPAPKQWPTSDALADLALVPDHSWVEKVRQHGTFGEATAQELLDTFTDDAIIDYPELRDRPDVSGTSGLAPHLHFGELSPRQVWHAASAYRLSGEDARPGNEAYIRQLYWRDFAYHLLYYFPNTPEEPLKPMFAPFPWVEDDEALQRWQRGQTGYPFVDAGMRELWETGWMHNRVRMVVASFLIKDLRIHWREGAQWFWDCLFDADLANNSLGWQWVAGCGADAAPYFRVFNPFSQGKKFDPDGEYVRKWVPELAQVPDKYLQTPWEMPPIELAACGVTLGKEYPHPMVDHGEARKTALAIYDELKAAK